VSAVAAEKLGDGLELTLPAGRLRGLLEGHVATGKSTIPALTTGVLVAGNGELTFTTNDMTIQLTRRIAGDFEPGAAAVDARLLGSALQGLDGDVTLTHDGKRCALRAAGRRYALPTVDVINVPICDAAPEEQEAVECDPGELAAAIRAVQYAGARKDVRYYLEAVNVETGAVVATDGHRVAWSDLPALKVPHKAMLLPIKAVSTILAVWPGDDDMEARLRREGNRAVFHTGEATLTVALVDGRFPEWRKIIDSPHAAGRQSVTFEAGDLREAVARIMPFVERESGGGKIFGARLEIGTRELVIQSSEAEERVAAYIDVDGDVEPVALNLAYLKDVARGSGTVTWHPNEPQAEQLFVIEGREHEGHVIMPVRL
jgi:DNA polymerase III subunit beta